MNARAVVVICAIVGVTGCRGREARSSEASREGRPETRSSCADFAAKLEADLRTIPRDVGFTNTRWFEVPELEGSRRALDRTRGYFVTLRYQSTELFDVSFRTGKEPLADEASEYIAAKYQKSPLPVLYALADRATLVGQLVSAIERVAEAERLLGRRLEVRWLVKIPAAQYRPYPLPPRSPTWVREIVAANHQGDLPPEVTVELERALKRSSPVCTRARDLAEEVIVHGDLEQQVPWEKEAGLAQALVECKCDGLDFDAFEGLVLGLSAHVSPYGYVVLATSEAGARTVTVARDATVEDLAAAWPRDVDEPVFVKLR